MLLTRARGCGFNRTENAAEGSFIMWILLTFFHKFKWQCYNCKANKPNVRKVDSYNTYLEYNEVIKIRRLDSTAKCIISNNKYKKQLHYERSQTRLVLYEAVYTRVITIWGENWIKTMTMTNAIILLYYDQLSRKEFLLSTEWPVWTGFLHKVKIIASENFSSLLLLLPISWYMYIGSIVIKGNEWSCNDNLVSELI